MQDTSVRTIGSRLEPFLDDWLLDRLDGATLRMHSPQPAEIFAFDRPWEGDVSFYVTMLEHEGEYRMYTAHGHKLRFCEVRPWLW